MSTEIRKLEEEIANGGMISVPPFLEEWLSRRLNLFIDGQWCVGESGEYFQTYNPSTGKKLADIAIATKADVEFAISSAKTAFETGPFAKSTLEDRSEWLKKIGNIILEHRAPLAILESLDTGKPIKESFEGDVLRAAQNFHFFAEFGLEEKELEFKNGRDLHRAFREPLGVVALVTPWNLPLYLETWKIAPALLMGNSIILKPSELTPLTACYFAELIETVDLPKGVFNLVQGFGEGAAGEFLVSHPHVDAISFTGETGTGRAIMRSAAVGPTRVSFELGGKGALIVFNDANIDDAVENAVSAGFRNQGEICLACPRVFIQEEKYQEFVDQFVSRTEKIRTGEPLDYSTTMGTLIGEEHYKKVLSYIDRVVAPAKILTGGKRPSELNEGYFLMPTIIEGLSHSHPISLEEVFGPVVSVYSFKTEDEIIELANQTQYGLSVSIWTEDKNLADRVARGIRSGLVWINCWFIRDLRVPFGGQKRSGVGREGGRHSLDFFSEWKSVCIRGGAE